MRNWSRPQAQLGPRRVQCGAKRLAASCLVKPVYSIFRRHYDQFDAKKMGLRGVVPSPLHARWHLIENVPTSISLTVPRRHVVHFLWSNGRHKLLALRPLGHPAHVQSSINLASYLKTRYDELGWKEDLEEAINLGREALILSSIGDADRSLCLDNLSSYLTTRYSRFGQMEDLEEAIVLGREALELRPPEHPDRSQSLSNLTAYIYTRYRKLGGMEDLEEAIVLGREALALGLTGHPNRSQALTNLALYLSARYNQLGGMEDLKEAIALGREVLPLHPTGHPDRSRSLSNLAGYLSTRYDELGGMEDLEEAIVLCREALLLRPSGHPGRSQSLSSLASNLVDRYNQLGGMEDLEEAIVLDREALELRPEGHPDRPQSLGSLSAHIFIRYRKLGGMEHLEEAIVLGRETLALCPAGHPKRPQALSILAIYFSIRYDRLGEKEDLEQSIALGREALELCPEGHPERWRSLDNLSAHIFVRYRRLGGTEHLEEAIVLGREALRLCPAGHPDPSALVDLVDLLRTRFRASRTVEDQQELFNLFTQFSEPSHFVSSAQVSAAKDWVDIAEEFHHDTLLKAYETALRLLLQHLTALPSLPRHHVLVKNLMSSLAVDAFSACLRNNAPRRAVELLERGRNLFWNQLARLRSPLHAVKESGPEGIALADEFTQLALQIRHTINSPDIVDQHERLWRLNLKLQQVVTNIRALPGLSHFLLPSPFSHLQSAARDGPVIILNASQYSCDALIVYSDQEPVHVPLRITQKSVRDLSTELRSLTKRAKQKDMSTKFAILLRRLWDDAVGPIVSVLQASLPHESRIWWCPTGEFSVLPIHAAGPFRKGRQGLPELYISSYTPTLTSLIRARQSHSTSSEPREKRFLAIGQAAAAGESELASVGLELKNIAQTLDGLANFTALEGEASCIANVSEELGTSDWAHFACHGIPVPKEPFKSAFGLHDGHFTIERIMGCELKDPEFAYLSACHTTVGDEESPDEAIHLAATMQFIGFRSVIGTMWAVADGETNKIVPMFYKHMVDESGRLDHTRAAVALHETVKEAAKKGLPFDQRILYVHIGV